MPNLIKVHIREHLHPLGGRIIFWNFVLLLIVKLIIPQSAFQTASLLGFAPTFDSRQIIKTTNEARLAVNLPILQPNSKLDLAASKKLDDMAIQEYFAHVSPSGVNPWYWIKNVEYQYSVAGENLAIGFTTAEDTIQAWLNSPSHKANVLNNKYQDIGVAVKTVEINGREGILVVQMFGSPRLSFGGAGKPSGQIVAVAKTPTPSPSNLPQPTPTRTTVANIPQTQGQSITLVQEVSTDPIIEPVKEPTIVKYQDAEKISKATNLLNSAFSVYILLIAGVSATAFFIFERNKNMALKMSLNFALFILAIVIPASKVAFEGLIF